MKNPSRPISAGAGFTLVEMLVVLGVIGLLIAILLPVLSAARTRAGNASRTLVLGDADTREPGTQLLTWRPPLVEGEPKAVSLGEVVAAPAANLVDRSIRLDPNRHRGRANFVFADGHGETRRADAADLGGVMLLAD